MDETSVGKRAVAPVEPEPPRPRNAAELTASEDQGRLFEPTRPYGVSEARARYALQAAGAEGFPARLYSRTARAIDAAPFEKGTPQQWQAHLSKNVPASEREHSGLDAFLTEHKTGTLTRQQVAEAFNAGRIRLTETTLGGRMSEEDVLAGKAAANQPRFKNWTEPGGENYAERILSLQTGHEPEPFDPDKLRITRDRISTTQGSYTIHYPGMPATTYGDKIELSEAGWQGLTDEQIAHTARAQYHLESAKQTAYTSSHWPGIRNPLIHVRTSDRVLPNGEKALLVEEIQSDWHQKGRKSGYKPAGFDENAVNEEINALNRELSRIAAKTQSLGTLAPADKAEYDATMVKRDAVVARYVQGKNGVPDAPLKKTEQWAELGLKKAIDEAVRGGYDRVVWVNGETQAARYDLSKHVDELRYNPQTETLTASKGGHLVHEGKYDARALAEVVGKDAADKLLAQPLASGATERVQLEKLRVDAQAELEKMRGEHPEDKVAHAAMMEVREPAFAAIERADRMGFDTVPEALRALRVSPNWPQDWELDNPAVDEPLIAKYLARSAEVRDLEQLQQRREEPIRERIAIATRGLQQLHQVEGTHQLKGADLKIGGAGMKAFYDKILPNIVKDYAKSLGVKLEVEPVSMGKSALSAKTIQEEGENMGERGRFENRASVLDAVSNLMDGDASLGWREAMDVLEKKRAYPITETQGAREWLERYEKDHGFRAAKTFQSFKVTPELRAKVAGEGQRIAEPKPNYDQLDAFTPQQLDAFSTPAERDARAVRVYGSVRKAARAIALVKEHAGKFATTYPTGAATPAGRLRKIGERPTTGSLVHLIGQSLNTPEAIAQALYPFRSPLAERFIVIGHAVDPGPGGGLVSKVTSATMDTAGAIDSFAPYGGGYKGLIRFAEEIAARLKRTGATEVDLVHNHPSGVVQESTADKLFLQGVGAYLYHKHGITVRGMGVMDHNKARWLYPDNTKAHGVGSYEVEVKPSGIDWTSHTKQVGPDEVLQIVGPGGGNGGLHVLYLDTQLQHLALEAHNPSALKTMGGSALPGRTDKVPGWLEAHAKGLGSGDVVLVGPAGSAEEIYAAVQAAGTHIRVRDIMTMSVGPDGKPTYTSEVQNGTIDSDNGISTARSGVAERQAHRGLAESIAPYGTARRNASTLREPSAEYGRGPEYRKARAAGIASGLTPEQADAYAAAAKDIDFDGAKAIAQAKLEAGGFRTRLRRWADSAADQTRAIDVLSRAAVARGMPKGLSPEYQLALSYNSSNTIERALFDAPAMATTHGILDPITREPMGPTLESVCEPLGEKPEKIRQGFTYAVSLRKVGRGLQGTAGDANQLQAALDAVQQLGKIPANREFARRLGVFVDGIGTYAVRSGLWTDQFWQKLKYSDILYITFGRLMTHMKRPEPSVTYGVKRANLTPGVMPFEGSRRVIKNPVEALAGYAAMIIRRSDAARVGSSVIDAILQYMGEEGKAILTPLAANDPAVKAFAAAAIRQNLARMGLDPAEAGMVADLSAPQIDPHNPVIWRNRKGGPAQVPPEQTNVFGEEEPFETGEREYFLLHQPDIYKALIATRADSPLGDWVIMKGFRMGRRIMTVTTTGINPRFALGLNIARDIPQAIMQVPGIRPDDIAAAFLEAAKTVAGQSEFADILARHGLGNASIYAHDINPEAAARRIAPVTQLQKIGAKTRHIVGWPLEMAERIGAASDLVARLAAARAVRRNALKAGATQRDALAAAATSGLRSTVNFNRRAGTRGMQFLEQSVPFFGASTRSIVRSTEAIDEVPGRVLGAIAIVTLAVLSEWAISKNDKERRARQVDRPASERSRFIQFGSYRWPLSQEMAVVAAGVRMGLAQFTKDDPDSAEQLVQAIYNLLPPVASDLVQGDFVAPWPGWREVQEVAQNRQAYGNRPIVPERLADLRPAMRRQPSTAPTFDVLAAGARKFAIIVPPLAETSPLAVEHVVRGFFNNMTPLLTMVTDAALKATPIGKELEVRVPMPLLQHPLMPTSAFVMREPPSRTSSETWFYDKMREFNQGESAERTVGKMEDLAETPAGAKRAERARRLGGGSSWGLDEERAADVGLVFKEAQLNLREYRELETEVRQWVNDGRLTPKAARSLLDSLTTERQHMLRETRKALELLGVPSGLRSSAETRAAPADTSAAKVPVKLTAPRMLNREP